MWVVRVTNSRRMFAFILRQELKENVYKLYQRFVADAQTDDAIVERLDEELGIIHIYVGYGPTKKAAY